MLVASSCSDKKEIKSGVIIGEDSVTIVRKMSRKNYDESQLRDSLRGKTVLKGFNIDSVSKWYLEKVAKDPAKYSISQITMNSDILRDLCDQHRIIRFVPTYFRADSKYPNNPQDTIALLIGFEDGGTPEWNPIDKYFSVGDDGMYHRVFCPPPGSCCPTDDATYVRDNPNKEKDKKP